MLTGQLFLDKAKWIMGWMTVEELSFLAEVSQDLKAGSVVLEIGSFCGRSARAIADNSPGSCLIYCIDPWEFKIPAADELIIVDESTYKQFCLNLYDHIFNNKVIPVISKWEDFRPSGKADFIFIDGSHAYEAASRDIAKAIEYTKPGGMIAGHDYTNFESVYTAVNDFFVNSDIHTKGTIWWTRKF